MRSALAAPHLPRHGPPPACRALVTAGSTQSAHLDREISAPGRSRSDNEPDNDRANTLTTTPIGGLFYLSSTDRLGAENEPCRIHGVRADLP